MSLNTVPFNPFPPSSDQKGSGEGGSYVLPAATDETLGGIKVGDNLTVEEDGTLNAPDPYSPSDYSTAEHATGRKWIDGKDVYEKTIVLDAPTIINANAWYTVGVLSAATVINVGAINSDGYYFPFGGGINNGDLEVYNMRSTGMTMAAFIIQYTKTETEE